MRAMRKRWYYPWSILWKLDFLERSNESCFKVLWKYLPRRGETKARWLYSMCNTRRKWEEEYFISLMVLYSHFSEPEIFARNWGIIMFVHLWYLNLLSYLLFWHLASIEPQKSPVLGNIRIMKQESYFHDSAMKIQIHVLYPYTFWCTWSSKVNLVHIGTKAHVYQEKENG